MVARPALPNLDTLPPQALKALIHAQHQTLTVQAEEIRAQREQLRSRDEQLAGRQAEIERLQLLIAKLRRMQFGRRSEKLSYNWTNWPPRRRSPRRLPPPLGRRPRRPPAGSRRDGRCRVICRGRNGRFCLRKRPVRTAAAS